MTPEDEELTKVVGSHLVKSGVLPMTAGALIKTAFIHRDMTKKLMETGDQDEKTDVLGTATEAFLNILLVQLCHSAEASGMEVNRMNAVMIATMLNKAATGCLLSTVSEDEARRLFMSLQTVAFNRSVEIMELFKEEFEKFEELKREKKNASIH